MRRSRRVEYGFYLQAFPLLAKNPIVIVPPLVAALLGVLISSFTGSITDPLGGFGAGILQFLTFLVDMFLFGVSMIIAQSVWRRGKATFDAAWEEAQRKAPSILMAAVGFQFVIYAAALLGNFLGMFGYLLMAFAVFFLIYTIPAAAIGGIPGGAAISASIERVKDDYVAALLLCVVSLVLYFYLNLRVSELLVAYVGTVAWLGQILLKAIVIGYLAFVFAKQYDQVAL